MFQNIHFDFIALKKNITTNEIEEVIYEEKYGMTFIPWLYIRQNHSIMTVVYKHKLLA